MAALHVMGWDPTKLAIIQIYFPMKNQLNKVCYISEIIAQQRHEYSFVYNYDLIPRYQKWKKKKKKIHSYYTHFSLLCFLSENPFKIFYTNTMKKKFKKKKEKWKRELKYVSSYWTDTHTNTHGWMIPSDINHSNWTIL